MEQEKARLFVGIELDEATRRTLQAWARALEREISGRYYAPDLYHVTLCFLGQTDLGRLPAIARAMEAAFRGPFSVRLGELGAFKGGSVLYAGLRDCTELTRLAARLRDGLRAEGFAMPKEPYVPHVTLARHARGFERPQSAPDGAFRVERIALFESARVDGRLCYTPRFRIPAEAEA